MSEPFVSVLIVNRNGRAALETCLPSLDKQDYPRDRFEVLVIDNQSTDDSVPFIRERFPSVRVLQHDRDYGLGAAIHAVLPQARGDHLAFLDVHTRVEPAWIRELVEATVRHEAAIATSKILNWDGTGIEFAGGILSLVGHTWRFGQGSDPTSCRTSPTPLLFGCADAMLVERGAYHAAGGFDPDYFAYGEDVDLGWRLSLLGYKAVLVPTSVVYRRDPAGRSAITPRLRLEERNALYTIYKCYGEDLLYRVLPVAIALTLGRALHCSDLNPDDFAPGASPPPTADVSRRTMATLMALGDFAQHLGPLGKKREALQSQRVVADEALLPLFLEPLKTHALGPTYQSLASELYDEFGLARAGSGPLTPPPAFSSPHESPIPRLQVRGDNKRPTVSIIVLTALGPTHLPECLSSLRELSYPTDKLEVIIVDNGSREDPTPVVRQHYPDAKLLRLPENRGFCAGIAAGAHESRADWLVFLNDDTRVDPEWLGEMLATAERRQAPCVAARILNWSGDLIDFAVGAIIFEGKGFQLGHGSKRMALWDEERPILFPCGAAMMVRRDVFLETGGFDEAMFAYYEDVAFGWQLCVRGHEVWLSPSALVFHKHQGTGGRWPSALRARLYERNALRTLFTLLELPNLQRALPASLLLVNQRILLAAGVSRRVPGESTSFGALLRRLYRRIKSGTLWSGARDGVSLSLLGGSRAKTRTSAYRMEDGLQDPSFDQQMESMPSIGAATLVALDDWLKSLPDQRRRRREIQRHRRRSDGEILSLFGSRWTSPAGAEPQAPYNRVHQAVVLAFSLEEITRRDGET